MGISLGVLNSAFQDLPTNARCDWTKWTFITFFVELWVSGWYDNGKENDRIETKNEPIERSLPA